MKASNGFTLAELLIALGILGVIATFTIPKILTSATGNQNAAIVKEIAGTVAGAHQDFSLNTGINGTTVTAGALTASMNYVRVDSVTTAAGGLPFNCATANTPCLQLHNGAYMQYSAGQTFDAATATRYVTFNIDPDGTGTAQDTTGSLVLYPNGRMVDGANATGTASTTNAPVINVTNPSWLAW